MIEALPAEWQDRPADPPEEFRVPVVELEELQNGVVLQSKQDGEFVYSDTGVDVEDVR